MQRREFIKTAAMAAGMPFLFGGCRTFRGNSKINVAIIGCGRISTEFEVPGVLNRPDIARIVAVCDLDMKRARQTAEHVEREYADGTKIQLTPMQQRLMEMFFNSPSHSLTKAEICAALWPGKPDASETLYTLIKRLKPVVERHSSLRIASDRSKAYRLITDEMGEN